MNKVNKINSIMTFFLCLPVCMLNATNYYAVCVGIADYSGAVNDVLNNTTVHDAEDMRSYLITYQGWSSANIVVRLNSNATESIISSDISNMPNSTGNSELFFYSGHGSTSGLTTYSGTFSPSELTASFGISFGQYCCFINSCHAGIFANNMNNGEISCACENDEYASAVGPDDNCVYPYYILEGIKNNQADPVSGHVVSVKEVHDYAAPKVTKYNPDMHPQFMNNFGVLNLAPLGPTVSGTLIDDELWDQNVTLTNDVTVNSGITLTIASGAIVNYNGYTLTSSGGTISIQSGGVITLNPATYVDIVGSGSTTYEVNGINVGASFNGIGQSIKAIPPSGFGVAGWSDGIGGNYREINGNITVNARLKALHKSNTTTAWDNTSQRKLIQTLAGGNTWLHQVYTSAGHVWIEHSGDGGSTWTLGNNGQPLDGTAGGKCPSIAYATHDQGYTVDNYIGVVWQEPYGTQYKIKGKIFSQYGNENSAPYAYNGVTTLFTEPNDAYASVNANPNLVLAQGYTSPYLVTFERKSTSGSLQPGINWLVGHTEDSGQRYLGPFGLSEEQGIITGTNANTTNVQLSIWPNTNMLDINLVQQAGATGAIYSHWISLYENLGNWNYYQFDDGMISYPSANKSPSITSLPNCLYSACWIEVQNMAFYYLGNPSVRYYYGVYGFSCSINRGGGTSSSGFAVWSQQPSSGTKLNKSIRFDGGYPVSSSIQTLSTTGKYVQVGNGATSNHSNMYVSSFYPNSLPYYFSTSQTLGPLSKSSPKIVEGRGFIIKKGDAYFKYNLEGLNVDGQNIAFVDASDEVDYSKIDNLNDVLLTEPFQLKEDSKVIFMEESGFADSIVASKAFGKEGYIHYKVELIDETTGNIVGIIKNVNFNASNVHITQKPTYSLNTKGLESKIVRAKITLETNLVGENSGKPTTTAQDLSHIPPAIREKRLNIKNPNIILTKSYSEENISLAKAIFEQLELEKPDIPISYSLAQNYPNPFNPTTTISYALPKAGNVTITVYNLLGEEVATLVKGERQEGRHSVTFDGSLLSSGTYLVRMHSGNYSKTIKILLIK